MEISIYITINDAIKRTGVSRTTLYRLLKKKAFKAVKVGHATRINKESLDRYFNSLPEVKIGGKYD